MDTDKDVSSDLNLIGQGSFSCIFRPSILCDNTVDDSGDNYYISKVTVNDKYIKNELEIASTIKTIPYFFHNFAPIEENCKSDIKKLLDTPGRDQLFTECDLFKQELKTPDADFVYNKIRYIGKKDLYDYLSTVGEHKYVDTYNYLLYSIDLLQEKSILHYDLKSNNVMMHEICNLPIMIDFGLSIKIDKVLEDSSQNLEEFKRAFYIYTGIYEVWCFEINLVCYLLHARGVNNSEGIFENESLSSPITEEDLKSVIIDFQKNPVFEIAKLDRENYAAELLAYFGKYVGKSGRESIIDIVRSYWKTWDLYSLAICFINAINYDEESSLDDNVFKKELFQYLSANPELRARRQ